MGASSILGSVEIPAVSIALALVLSCLAAAPVTRPATATYKIVIEDGAVVERSGDLSDAVQKGTTESARAAAEDSHRSSTDRRGKGAVRGQRGTAPGGTSTPRTGTARSAPQKPRRTGT